MHPARLLGLSAHLPMSEEQFIRSVEEANPQLVGRKLSIHWDTVESLMRKMVL